MHTRTPRSLRRGAAGALIALVALCGCSSDGDDADAAAKPTRSISEDQAAGIPDDQASPPAETSAAPSKGPVLPDAKLTPATGSFTDRQKKYLHGRVPKNMDPAAVLQLGEETCQRVERTAAHDEDAAVGALIAGDLPSADAAIEKLCPKQKPLLAKAATGFADGTRKNPDPGSYRALTTAEGCTWKALGPDGKPLASGPGPDAPKKVTAKIPSGTRTFISTGCYAWLPA
ncbi:hypothetical protein ACGFS9_00805 [Streptomyces sp. NPDC048566]|uniref:hypothetical protein n=1 Tax=Streptomyces sp. NPDC048566 TaxID=3365569 RepID=UPI003715CE7E